MCHHAPPRPTFIRYAWEAGSYLRFFNLDMLSHVSSIFFSALRLREVCGTRRGCCCGCVTESPGASERAPFRHQQSELGAVEDNAVDALRAAADDFALLVGEHSAADRTVIIGLQCWCERRALVLRLLVRQLIFGCHGDLSARIHVPGHPRTPCFSMHVTGAMCKLS